MISEAGRVLRSPRLVLAPVNDRDVEQLHAHWNDPAVGCHLWDGPVPADAVRDLVACSERGFTRAGYGIWAIRRTMVGGLVGACGFREAEGQLELLLSLDPAVRGQGLATEAARVVLDHTVRVGSVVAFTDADNVPSQRVLARLGMTPYDFAAPPRVRWRLGGTR